MITNLRRRSRQILSGLTSIYILGACQSLSAQQTPQPLLPNLEELNEIVISPRTGWMLEVKKDGSASLIFGSNPADIAIAPSGSINFHDTYHTLAPTLQLTSSGSRSVPVTMRRPNEISTTARYTNNEAAVSRIFLAVQQCAKPLDDSRFAELLKGQPFLLKAQNR